VFKIVDRNEKEFCVLIPGWAFDHRIFNKLDLKFNYILYNYKASLDFEAELKEILNENNIEKVSMLGWSQGAFLASDFAWNNPDNVEELILISMRKKYEKEGLNRIKTYLKKSKTAYLYKFYNECFGKDDKDCLSWFKKNLFKTYLKEMETEELIKGLDRLAGYEIDQEVLGRIGNVKIVHGQEDKIAPLSEIADIKNSLPNVEFMIFKDSGHLPFLREDFKERLYA
jgi:pimeloyl-ACP methyl ester carboxylesterase